MNYFRVKLWKEKIQTGQEVYRYLSVASQLFGVLCLDVPPDLFLDDHPVECVGDLYQHIKTFKEVKMQVEAERGKPVDISFLFETPKQKTPQKVFYSRQTKTVIHIKDQ